MRLKSDVNTVFLLLLIMEEVLDIDRFGGSEFLLLIGSELYRTILELGTKMALILKYW